MPRPYCATGPVRVRSVTMSTRVPPFCATSVDSIVACALPRPRDSRASVASTARCACSSAVSRVTSASKLSEIGPSFTASFAFQ